MDCGAVKRVLGGHTEASMEVRKVVFVARKFDMRLSWRILALDMSLIRISKCIKFDMFEMFESSLKT